LRDFGGVGGFFTCANRSSSSPLRTAMINVSMTAGILSSDGTAIAVLPFSNSTGFQPDRTKNAYDPLAFTRRLLLFTGCRLREILHLKWEHVDLERGLLFLADSKTGKKTVILNASALAVLIGLDRLGSYVVPGDDQEKPRTDPLPPREPLPGLATLRAPARLADEKHGEELCGRLGDEIDQAAW
jgi:hypothetical protein